MPRRPSTAASTTTISPARAAALLLAAALAAAAVTPTAAAAWRPTDPGEVLERLPRLAGSQAAELAGLRRAVQASPDDAAAAVALARRYIAIGRGDADPRWDGYAEAVLDRWWRQPEPPTEAVLLRAVLAQRGHRFEPALADLAQVLEREPRHAEAWLVKAGILLVTGRPQAALDACRRLDAQAPLPAVICTARARALAGGGDIAYRRLAAALAGAATAATAERQWAETVLGEIARGLGDRGAAERHFRRAMAATEGGLPGGGGGESVYVQTALADLLLADGRAAEARRLLAGETAADPLLLRLAIAETRLGHPDRDAHRALLADRFAAARLRGDAARHRREEALFALAVDDRPADALALALANWQVQREPADARLLAEAAVAAGQPQALAPLTTWITETGFRDAETEALLAGVGAKAGARAGAKAGAKAGG